MYDKTYACGSMLLEKLVQMSLEAVQYNTESYGYVFYMHPDNSNPINTWKSVYVTGSIQPVKTVAQRDLQLFRELSKKSKM